jgi:hypothetical protein
VVIEELGEMLNSPIWRVGEVFSVDEVAQLLAI